MDAQFSPDGRILTMSADGTARIYDLSLVKPLSELLALADRRQTRPLTAEERVRFLH